MARAFTLGDLVTAAKQRADMENASFVSDLEWKSYLSSAYAELYSILSASGLRYFEAVDVVETNGNSSYPIVSDFLSVVGVDYLVGKTAASPPGVYPRRALVELMAQERNVYSAVTGASEAVAFALIGTNLELYPIPPSGQIYELVYIPQPQQLGSASDITSVDVVTPDGEQFLVWYAVLCALAKEESDTALATQERERARMRLEQWATLRAMHQPRRRIVDDGWPYDYDAGDWRRGGWGW